MTYPVPGYGVCGEDDAAIDAVTAATDDKAALIFGAHVFFLLHEGGDVPALSGKCHDWLEEHGWTDWFCPVEKHPLAAGLYLFLCSFFEIKPEATS